jgi:DNA (cytosine-5)-methyltransferase 1
MVSVVSLDSYGSVDSWTVADILLRMQVISLFSGAGGLDLGFEKAGFETVFANEYDKTIWATYQANFPKVHLDTRSIVDIPDADVPKEADGLIGGPPCQSWSEAGAHRGIEDQRGQLFFEYERILKHVKPKFFLAENVSGILSSRHSTAFAAIIDRFRRLGYDVNYRMLRASDFGVPQDRDRVIIVGLRSDLGCEFAFPEPVGAAPTMRDVIHGMPKPRPNPSHSKRVDHRTVDNHEYLVSSFSSMYMSRNRVRAWDQQSFTIQAGARHAPIHPSAPKMEKMDGDKFRFALGHEEKYRRLSVRECARIQTFPDTHQFCYERIVDGYKMIGNAVPVEFGFHLAKAVKTALAGARGRRGAAQKSMKKTKMVSAVEVKAGVLPGKTRKGKDRRVVGQGEFSFAKE